MGSTVLYKVNTMVVLTSCNATHRTDGRTQSRSVMAFLKYVFMVPCNTDCLGFSVRGNGSLRFS